MRSPATFGGRREATSGPAVVTGGDAVATNGVPAAFEWPWSGLRDLAAGDRHGRVVAAADRLAVQYDRARLEGAECCRVDGQRLGVADVARGVRCRVGRQLLQDGPVERQTLGERDGAVEVRVGRCCRAGGSAAREAVDVLHVLLAGFE